MVKLEIDPAFIASCVLELVQQESCWRLVFTKCEFKYRNEKERTWRTDLPFSPDIDEVIYLAKTVISEAKKDDRMMLDGVSLRCSIAENNVTSGWEFRCPTPDSNELRLVQKFLLLAENTIKDESFTNYVELLEGYFFGKLPVKVFYESPFRIKIYGSLSIYEKEGFTRFIEKLGDCEEVLVDMTNFQSMGTALYECFTPLIKMQKIHFIANENALRQLQEMHVDPAKISITKGE